MFRKPDWARPTGTTKAADLGPSGPVSAEDLVGPDGRCGPSSAEQAQAAAVPPPAQPAADQAGAPAPAGANPAEGEPPPAPMLGGIALGMTECQAVRRAGTPANVAINAGDKGERSVVLTYLTGTWPGIYHFNDGRLNVIDRAPAPPEPPKPVKKKIAKKVAPKPKVAPAQ